MTSTTKLLHCITSNHDKAKEILALLRPTGIEADHVSLSLTEIQSDSLEQIVEYSIREAYDRVRAPVLAEDSGLFIKILNGFPGPFSHYVFSTIGNEGVLRLMEHVQERRGEFRSAVAYSEGQNPRIFLGVTQGRIAEQMRGTGWGFDPIFIPDERPDQTFAEMGITEKNKMSHRRKSIQTFISWYLSGR